MTDSEKAQQREYNKKHYQYNKEKRKAITMATRQGIRDHIIAYKLEHPCKCGESHPAALQFHHRNPAEKTIEVSAVLRRGWSIKKLDEEIAKCDVICANCHLKLHWNEKQ